ncbi:MAG: sigma-70 family RNA polymerase sigma factor [Candidatus Zixiibacteriota bacterium]|nr:MAG: sigma-70 family RNA polymerase sigma factor [candidate division Zixibacteria bacterium]
MTFASIIVVGINEADGDAVERILNGDTEAFQDIVRKYKGLVFHVVREMLSDQGAHDDVAQDIFIRVFEHLPRFEFRSGLATWISRIAYNTCLNHLRRMKSRPQDSPEYRVDLCRPEEIGPTCGQGPETGSVQTPQAVILRKEISRMVRGSINRLPQQARLIVTLHYLDGFSISDLAETLRMPPGTVKSHLFRARALLKRDLLEKIDPEDLV